MTDDIAQDPAGLGRGRWFSRLVWRSGAVCALLAIVLFMLGSTGCMEKLFFYPSQGPTPIPSEFPDAEAVHFRSADGTSLYGWFIPAQGPAGTEKPAATIVHAHGNAGDITDHIWFSEFLPQAGFNLFIFDYRGYGQSGGKARKRDLLLADVDAALDTVLARDDVDPDRVGLYGVSLGGSLGLCVMERREEIRAALILAAFASWRDIAADSVGGEEPGFLARSLAAILIKDHLRPIDAIAGTDRPILIIHGGLDSIVPTTHGRRLAEAGPTAELIVLPQGDHNDLRNTHPEVDEIISEFFRSHLAGRASPAVPMGD